MLFYLTFVFLSFFASLLHFAGIVHKIILHFAELTEYGKCSTIRVQIKDRKARNNILLFLNTERNIYLKHRVIANLRRDLQMKRKKNDAQYGFLLNTQMIVDDLEEYYPDIIFSQGHDTQTLIGIHIYYGQEKISRDYIYIAASNLFDKFPIRQRGMSVISVGETNRTSMGENCSIIIAPGKYDMGEICNKVQDIFEKYHNWIFKLKTILSYDGSVDELCRASLDFFDNPMFVHDEKFNILSFPRKAVGMMIPELNKKTGTSMVPSDAVNDFKFNSAYIETLSTRGAHIWDESPGRHRVIYVNIWGTDKNYMGRLGISEMQTSLKPGQFITAEYFVEILKIAMLKKNVFIDNEFHNFEDFVKNMMLGRITNEDYIKKRVSLLGWDLNDEYLCMKVDMDLTDINILSIHSTCNEFETKFKECYTFFYENSIWVLINLSVGKQTKASIRMKMAFIIREGVLKAGVSNICQNFLKISYYFTQAAKALDYGIRCGSTLWHFDFFEYAVDYVLRHGCEKMPYEFIVCDQMRVLTKYDDNNDTELYKTLKIYLQNDRSITHTSNELFIHRSTLTYRLERIQEITGLDFNDFYTRLYLNVSFRLANLDITE